MPHLLHDFFHQNDEIRSLSLAKNLPLLEDHIKLTQIYPQYYHDWQKRFPFDRERNMCLELTAQFYESSEFQENHSLENRFLNFCQNFWHLVLTQPAHTNREKITNELRFHTHLYKSTKHQLFGPHPRDMTSSDLNFDELTEELPFLMTKASQVNPVLVHTSTGDDLYDHTYGAIWIKRTLPLDFSKLD
jgi:aromatic ring-cleaving dioxygenase